MSFSLLTATLKKRYAILPSSDSDANPPVAFTDSNRELKAALIW